MATAMSVATTITSTLNLAATFLPAVGNHLPVNPAPACTNCRR